MSIGLLMTLVFVLNLPFGYWRAGHERFSRDWFLSVHLPVPLIVALRLIFSFGITAIPFSVLAFFMGQYVGGYLRRRFAPVKA